MRASYHPEYVVPLPPRHSFPMPKFAKLREILLAEEILAPADIVEPEQADWDDLRLVHDRAYLDALRDGALSRDEQRRMGLPWSERLVRRSRFAVQGTINALGFALDDGIAANLAGGTHHAMPAHGEGYCVLNDVGVALKWHQRAGAIRRALVIDLDVHQGNGTAKIFANDDSVFTFSMHGAKNFPLRKEQSDLDVPLDDGTGDDDYLALLERHLPTLWDRARPDVVIYLQGVDPHEHDKFGRMKLTDEGLYRRDRRVLSEVQRRGSPVLMLLAGGYAVPPNAPRNQRLTSPDLTANLHAMQHRAARDLGMIRTAQPGQAHV